MVCCDLTLSGSLFHSTGKAVAKPRLPMAFLGQTEDTDNLFPSVTFLLDLIMDDNYGDGERFMALKLTRLYLKRI